jgi:hypothetical protein
MVIGDVSRAARSQLAMINVLLRRTWDRPSLFLFALFLALQCTHFTIATLSFLSPVSSNKADLERDKAMEHALFLEKPIRGNPRRRDQKLEMSMSPSSPCETASTALSDPSRSSSAYDSDGQLTWTTDESTTEHMAVIASMTRPYWRTDTDLLVNNSASPDQPPQESTKRQSPLRQRRRKITKAACSLCQKRKSKV